MDTKLINRANAEGIGAKEMTDAIMAVSNDCRKAGWCVYPTGKITSTTVELVDMLAKCEQYGGGYLYAGTSLVLNGVDISHPLPRHFAKERDRKPREEVHAELRKHIRAADVGSVLEVTHDFGENSSKETYVHSTLGIWSLTKFWSAQDLVNENQQTVIDYSGTLGDKVAQKMGVEKTSTFSTFFRNVLNTLR